MYAFETFQKQVESALIKAGLKKEQIKLEMPPEGIGADLAMPCFELAKELKKNPAEIAKELEGKISLETMIERISASGPYLNFYIKPAVFGQAVLKQAILEKNYGNWKEKESKKAVVDFSGPNPVHPFHMGTLRSTLLGESLCRILEFYGWKVKRVSYTNDVGKQAATLLLAYSKWGGKPKAKEKPDVWLGELYMRINKIMDEKLEEQAYELLRLYETGDKKIRAMGKKIFSLAMASFKQDWKMLGIKFDNIIWESQFIPKSKNIVEKMKKAGLAFKTADGALVLDLEKHGLPSTIILRSDGTGLYLTRDIPYAIWKEKSFKPDANLYVVGEDQALHFKQLFKTLELLGHKGLADISQHLSYSLVTLEGKKMSARKGRMVLWDELLAEGKNRALAEVSKRWPKLSAAEKEKRAEHIALAAIVYFILRYSPEKIVDFKWKAALAFEGATGPYIQYSYARAKAILRKGKIKDAEIRNFDAALLKNEKEKAVLRRIASFPKIVKEAAEARQPHMMANFVYDLATTFNEFYQSIPVLKAENETRKARLALVAATANVLKNGLYLLDIPAMEKM